MYRLCGKYEFETLEELLPELNKLTSKPYDLETIKRIMAEGIEIGGVPVIEGKYYLECLPDSCKKEVDHAT